MLLTKQELSQLIHEAFFLDAENGRLFWREPSKYHSEKIGREAGTIAVSAKEARCFVKIEGKRLPRAWAVFILHNNRWPEGVVDHINRNPLDDRPVNLRDVTVEVNNHNHGRVNVRKLPSGRWQARIGKETIGTFDTKENAVVHYILRRVALWGT